MHIQNLAAVADRQYRFVVGQSVFKNCRIGAIAIRVQSFRLVMARLKVARRIDVGGTARQNKRIERGGLLGQISFGEPER